MANEAFAVRTTYLDQEFNVPTADLSSVFGNDVFNAPEADAEVAERLVPKEATEIAKNLKDSFSFVKKNLNLLDINAAARNAIQQLKSLQLTDIAARALEELENLTDSELGGFIKDMIEVGNFVLCTNLDYLKRIKKLLKFDKSILTGLLMGLMLSWLGRVCNAKLNPVIRKKFGPKRLLERTLGTSVPSDVTAAFHSFKTYFGNYLYYQEELSRYANNNIVPDTYIASCVGLSVALLGAKVSYLQNYDWSSDKKTAMLTAIDARLSIMTKNSPDYLNLLYFRGEVIKLPFVALGKSSLVKRYEYLDDYLGRLIKALPKYKLDTLSTLNFTQVENSLLTKLIVLQLRVSNESIFANRSDSLGSFDNVDFSSILPAVDMAEKTYLLTLGVSDTFRWNGLPPTSSVFLR